MPTRQRILSEASRLFNLNGWQHVTVRAISESINISPGNLSYHFPTKKDLICALLGRLWEAEQATYLEFLDAEVSLGLFLHLIRSNLRVHLDHHGTMSIQYMFREEMTDEMGVRLEEIKGGIFKRIMEQLVASGELSAGDEDISFLVSFLLMFTRSWIMDQSLDGERDIDRHLYLLAQQLYYFSSEKGFASIDQFLAGI